MAYGNALLPLAIDVPDIAGAYFRGQQMYGAQQEQEAKNALRAAMQQYGPAAMRGDQNALAQLAQFDPQLGLSMMGDQQAMDLRGRADARAERESASGLRLDEARLGQIRESQRMAAAQHAMQMDAATREREASDSQRETAMLTMAYKSGPEEWARVAPGILGGQAVSFEDAPYIIAGAQGSVEGLIGADMTSATQTLQERANLGGLQPGTPEYQEFMLSGPVQRTEDLTTQFRPATPDEAKQYGAAAGQVDTRTNRFYASESKDTVTEGERKASGYYDRMVAAEQTMQGLAGEGTDRIGLGEQVLMGVPFMPEGMALGAQSEQLLQAQRDWVRAKLRLESGAVIGAEEMADEIKTYFPQPGESEQVVRQKAQARQQAMEQVKTVGGRAVKNEPAALDDNALFEKYGITP